MNTGAEVNYTCTKCGAVIHGNKRQIHSWGQHKTKDIKFYELVVPQIQAGINDALLQQPIIAEKVAEKVAEKIVEKHEKEKGELVNQKEESAWQKFKTSLRQLWLTFDYVFKLILNLFNFFLSFFSLIIALVPALFAIIVVTVLFLFGYTYWDGIKSVTATLISFTTGPIYVLYHVLLSYDTAEVMEQVAARSAVANGLGQSYMINRAQGFVNNFIPELEKLLSGNKVGTLVTPSDISHITELWLDAAKKKSDDFKNPNGVINVLKALKQKLADCLALAKTTSASTENDCKNIIKACKLDDTTGIPTD